MATRKHPEFTFGGVDSRSNPANYPPERALRCLNFAPQASGQNRLRAGYTVPMQADNDSVGATAIHSLIYYEEFSASYLGPQFVLYGKGSNIEQFNLTSGASTQIGSFTTSNPWGHFRSKNRLFISDGTTQYNWDGTNLRVSGLPGPPGVTLPGLQSAFAGSGVDAGGGVPWSNPGNIIGPPDGNYAISTIVGVGGLTDSILATGYNFTLGLTTKVFGLEAVVTLSASQAGVETVQFRARLIYQGAGFGDTKIITIPTGGPFTITLGNASDAWNASLTPTIVNDPTFGIEIQGQQNPQNGNSATWGLDAIQLLPAIDAFNLVQVNVVASSIGSFTPTLLTGYQLFAALYDTVTGHMGNRISIGGVNTVGDTLSAIVLNGLPDPRQIASQQSVPSSELVIALGMTQDGAEIPYWLTDAQGNNIIVANGASVATVTIGLTNITEELPINNNPPAPMDKFARVGTRTFGHKAGEPFLRYSNDEADISNADYVGNPEESWPPNQQEPLPTAEMPTAIHGWRLEGWFFSRNNLCIWSNFLLQQGVNPWRGPWPGGCCGQRAFIETPYGPYWLTPQKQLCTFMEDGVISVSEEYEAALLGQIADTNLGSAELSYLLDAQTLTDQIVIKGTDANGNPVIVVHDFRLKDQRSSTGQGYSSAYTGLTVQTFAGAGFTPRQNVYDTSGRMRLWAGATQGFIGQLEDGVTDNGQPFTGDYIGLLALGPNRPGLGSLEIQGDEDVEVTWTKDYSQGDLSQWNETVQELIPGETSVWEYKMVGEARWLYARFLLTSDPDAVYAAANPPFVPLPTTGYINQVTLKLGTDRPEAA